MKTLHATALLFLFFAMSSSLQAQSDDGLLRLCAPAYTNGSVGMITAVAKKYAALSESLVDSADKAAVQNYVAGFAPGTAPAVLTVSIEEGTWSTEIGSRSAAYFVLGVQAVTQESRNAALWCFAEAASRNPADPVYVNALAFELLEHGYMDDAETLLRWVVNKAPEFSEALDNLAYIEGEGGRHQEAGDLFLQAVAADPFDSYAMYAAAREFKQAGLLDKAWDMAAQGEDSFPEHFDYTDFLANLGYPPEAGTCSAPACQSQACSDVFAYQGTALGSELLAELTNYETTVSEPAGLANLKLQGFLRSQAMEHLQEECEQHWSPYYEICRCEGYKAYALADLVYYMKTYQQDSLDLNYKEAAYDKAWRRYIQYFGERSPEMEETEREAMDCWLERYRVEQEILRGEERRKQLASDSESISLAQAELSSVAQFYCPDHIFYVWIFTIETQTNFEPKLCAGPICVSKDADSDEEAIEASFVGSIKFARNPHTGRGSITFGLGHSFGVSSFNYGAAIQATIGGDKIGIQGKVNQGWYETGLFTGFKRIRTTWSSYD